MSKSDHSAIAASAACTAAIRQRIAEGGSLTVIAAEFGVSRQYVSSLKIQQANGAGPPPGRGRRDPLPFTKAERAAFAAALQGPPPRGKSALADVPRLWTRQQARQWFLRKFGRLPQARQLATLVGELGVEFTGTRRENYDASFYRWQASPAAAHVREVEARHTAELTADLEADRGPSGGKMSKAELRDIERFNAATARQMSAVTTPQRAPARKIGRNDPCPRNPTLKFKRCCGANGSHYCTRATAP
ncbi:MAG: hypothetical protein LBK60_05855 [Verrucomicrobiales bacterium]|nr:hypothetical protein [Verrucomicrobiales bacterium]